LLLDYGLYNCSIDIWAAGCIFAGLLFGEEPFFASGQSPPSRSRASSQLQEVIEDLTAVSSVLGSAALLDAAARLGLRMSRNMQGAIGLTRPRTPWSEYARAGCHALAALATPAALDLLGRMLTAHPGDRASAEECLAHPYFLNDGD
jgi:casein kinase II subunit alpha